MRTVVRVFFGEYDISDHLKLRAEFDGVREEPKLILDMRGVTYVDSTFATELLRLHKFRVENGLGEVSIVRSAAIVKRLFAILYFKTLFRLAETLEEVLPRNGKAVVIQCAYRSDDSLFFGLPVPAVKTGKPVAA